MKDLDLIKLGIVFKKLRLENNLTLEEVAKELNVTHKAVQFWEQGRNEIKLSHLILLCKLYKTTLNDVIESAI